MQFAQFGYWECTQGLRLSQVGASPLLNPDSLRDAPARKRLRWPERPSCLPLPPTKSRRSGAERHWRDLSPAPARGKKAQRSAAPRSLFPPPFSRGGRGGGGGGGGGNGAERGRGAELGEESRPKRPGCGRCGWGGGAAEAEVRDVPCRPRPQGPELRGQAISPEELREPLPSAHNLGRAGSTSRSQRRKARVPDRGARADPNGEAAAGLGQGGGRPEGGRRVCRPARPRGTRAPRGCGASLTELRGGPGAPHSAVCAAGPRAGMLRPAAAALALRRAFSSSSSASRLFLRPDLGSRGSGSFPPRGEGGAVGVRQRAGGDALSPR